MFRADDCPPDGRNYAMAYRSAATTRASSGQQRVWEDLRKEARKLEGELDGKLAAYGKLASTCDSNYRSKADNGIGFDQLAQTKSAEIEALLQRLSDLNDEMSSLTGGSGDSRSHTLARHRDILQELSQEHRRLTLSLGAARDRAELLTGATDTMPLLSVQVQSGALLRERTTIASSTAMMEETLQTAVNVSKNLVDQGRIFTGISSKLTDIGARFPVVKGLLNAIQKRKSRDTLILSGVIAACIIFTIVYLMYK